MPECAFEAKGEGEAGPNQAASLRSRFRRRSWNLMPFHRHPRHQCEEYAGLISLWRELAPLAARIESWASFDAREERGRKKIFRKLRGRISWKPADLDVLMVFSSDALGNKPQ